MAYRAGNCGRGALWYGNESEVLAGLLGRTDDAVFPSDVPYPEDDDDIKELKAAA